MMLSHSRTVSDGEYAACFEAWWKTIPVLDFKPLIPRIRGVSEPNIVGSGFEMDSYNGRR